MRTVVASALLIGSLLVAASARAAPACYERRYDDAHLKKHPEQPVVAIKLWDLGGARRAVWLELLEGSQHLPLVRTCTGEGARVSCGPDDGGFSVEQRKDGALLRLDALELYTAGGEHAVPADVYRLAPCRPDEEVTELWSLEGSTAERGEPASPTEAPWLSYTVLLSPELTTSPALDGLDDGGAVRFRTRLRDEKGKERDAAVIATLEGPGCKGPLLHAAVVDVEGGRARVFTSRGKRGLVDLATGIKDGIRVVDRATLKEVARFPSPDIDDIEAVVGVGDDGAVLFSNPVSKRCVALTRSGKLEHRERASCAREREAVPSAVYDKLGFVPDHERSDGWRAIAHPKSRYLVFVRFVATC